MLVAAWTADRVEELANETDIAGRERRSASTVRRWRESGHQPRLRPDHELWLRKKEPAAKR